MNATAIEAKSILSRTGGFLTRVCSHSLQPYRGCALGNSLCGVGCYVRHSRHLHAGRTWGQFLDVKINAAEIYAQSADRERAWARRARGSFVIFLSSATEPFPPHERRFGVTRSVLQAISENPPDGLIVQTHSPSVVDFGELLEQINSATNVRVHISIESDRDRLPGLPPPASSVAARLAAARNCRDRGIFTVVTVSPLLPIQDPTTFFKRIAESADAVVLDHFIGGDGTANGSRTRKTPLPAAMAAVDPDCLTLDYRDLMGAIAEQHLPGRVGYHIDGFAARWTSGTASP